MQHVHTSHQGGNKNKHHRNPGEKKGFYTLKILFNKVMVLNNGKWIVW